MPYCNNSGTVTSIACAQNNNPALSSKTEDLLLISTHQQRDATLFISIKQSSKITGKLSK
jgi:hypothetical protein